MEIINIIMKTKQKETVKKAQYILEFSRSFNYYIKRSHMMVQKRIIKVDFPITNLDLSKYIKGYNASKYIYDLYGICNHMGNINRGHYTCYIKKGDSWIDINDENICKINEKNLITPMSYCLFYRKKKTNDNINVR